MSNDQRFENKYIDVLQNMEFGIINVYREHTELTDWDTLDAVEALIRAYTADMRARLRPKNRLSDLSRLVFDSVEVTCEWRLGRTQVVNKESQPTDAEMEPRTLDEIIACLKRIRRSIRLWNKKGGRQGYLNFIREFIT
jgi:hypothetical protein